MGKLLVHLIFAAALTLGTVQVVSAEQQSGADSKAQATPVERGRAKAVQCIACHGAEGRTTNPTFPDLAGQNAAYIEIQLQDFRSGERYHPVMAPVADALTDQDISDLADYFSSLGPSGDTGT